MLELNLRFLDKDDLGVLAWCFMSRATIYSGKRDMIRSDVIQSCTLRIWGSAKFVKA